MKMRKSRSRTSGLPWRGHPQKMELRTHWPSSANSGGLLTGILGPHSGLDIGAHPSKQSNCPASTAKFTIVHNLIIYSRLSLSHLRWFLPVLARKVLRAKGAAHPGDRKQTGLQRKIPEPLMIPFPLHSVTKSTIGRQPHSPKSWQKLQSVGEIIWHRQICSELPESCREDIRIVVSSEIQK